MPCFWYLSYDELVDGNGLLAKAREYLPEEKLPLVEKAYEFALKSHRGQVRKSGEPYLEHPLAVATILAELQFDAATLAAALLHDVPEDCNVPLDKIRKDFGAEVASLVEGTTKLSQIAKPIYGVADQRELQAENLRKMLIATAEDLRVIIIKLADRLHNMRTLGALPREKRLAIAQETLEIYAPLSHRLGISSLKWQLEDLAFRYLEPRQYHRVARLIDSRREEREQFTAEVVQELSQELNRAGVEAKVFGRPKHVYSIYHKMEKYTLQGKDFGDIYDLFGVRVLVDSESDCYKALGAVHNLWHPVSEEFNDFIANPKPNDYRSLHTTVLYHGTPLEVQIRTHEMDRVAEFGIAAHWRYKEEGKRKPSGKIDWLPQLVEWREEFDSREFLESFKNDVLAEQVYVFTPKGEIKELPRGATPLDFAFLIHTDLGYHCVGAKVNGRLSPLNQELDNGDVVEIVIAKGKKGPSLDWLNFELGYVKTSHARAKIRQWFTRQNRRQSIEMGRQFLERELKRTGVALPGINELAQLCGYKDSDDFLAALGSGNLSPSQVIAKLTVTEELPEELPEAPLPRKISPASITVLGVGDLVTHLANCCHPLPGDKIIGYITQGRGITVHQQDCPNIANEEEKERLIEVDWGEAGEVYPVSLQISAWDRVGLVRDVSTIIAEEGVNITDVNMTDHDNIVTLFFNLEVKDSAQLTSLISKIYTVWDVINVKRKGGISVER